ncbi:MAG: Hypothetical protein LKU_02323 [Lactobacillus kefiranofaciens]
MPPNINSATIPTTNGAIESLTAGHSYLDDFGRKINQINI